MQIGIISDSHDNLPNIYKALDYFKQRGVEQIIHCGDISAGSVLVEISQKFDGHTDVILGNVHGGEKNMFTKAGECKNVTLHGDQAELEIGGKKIAVNHYPWEAEKLAESGRYDVVFYGHDHKAWEKTIGKTKLYNPGTLAGLFAKPTFAIYDTDSGKAELILIEKI